MNVNVGLPVSDGDVDNVAWTTLFAVSVAAAYDDDKRKLRRQ